MRIRRILLIVSVLMMLTGCSTSNSEVKNRYDDQSDIDVILLENGIIELVFIEGWGSMDTSSIFAEDSWNIPVLDSAEKSTIAVGYDNHQNLKFIFIPMKENRDIQIYDFPFPDINVIENEVTKYNESLPVQTGCSNEIDLELSSDYSMHTSDNFGLIYFNSNNVTEYNLMLFIGRTCFTQKDLGVFVVRFSQTEFGIIASEYGMDIYYELVRFGIE